jgi:hypothetical protein
VEDAGQYGVIVLGLNAALGQCQAGRVEGAAQLAEVPWSECVSVCLGQVV